MKNQIKYIFLFLSGLLISLVASIAILGYIFGIKELYSWDGSVGMSLPTSMCFASVGINMMMVSTIFEKTHKTKHSSCK